MTMFKLTTFDTLTGRNSKMILSTGRFFQALPSKVNPNTIQMHVQREQIKLVILKVNQLNLYVLMLFSHY